MKDFFSIIRHFFLPDSSFLDHPTNPTKPTSKEITTEKLHKIDLDRNEVVENGKMSQFNETINPKPDQGISTTQVVPTTAVPDVITKLPSTLKPTTSTVPLDDHTTPKAKVTTEKSKVTTEAAKATTPAPEISGNHLLKWIVGEST